MWVSPAVSAEIFARQMERVDLPAAVAQQLEGANRAAPHAVEIFRGFAFAVNLFVAIEGDLFGGQAAEAAGRRTGSSFVSANAATASAKRFEVPGAMSSMFELPSCCWGFANASGRS